MKSYIQGIITGGALVFATMVFMGATNKDSQISKYELEIHGKGVGTTFWALDTSNGQLYNWTPKRKTWNKSGYPIQN